MYGSERAGDDVERTAFRKKKQLKQVDLSEVLDFKFISELFNLKGELPPGVVHVSCGFDRSVFGLENLPGFYFIPGALTLDEQCKWIRESLMKFPQPPNRTNHNVIYRPISNLFSAAKEGKVFVEERSNNDLDSDSSASVSNGESHRWKFYEEGISRSRGKTCKLVPASVLLRKLRWSTLGLQFNWSNRNYDVSLPHKKIPDALCQLAKRMAAPAMPIGEEFLLQAAIVNYFGSGDALGGHLDDMEADWSKPIVSMSFGCKAIFLLGGKSREDEPLAMFLRSGDVVLMAGEARECFHGVPRIFTD
ncbi:Alpha-ketoglutarate-dependent dioxygenase alkB [Hibiscus syriacus]|uniref:Alpha-ketoglutarate-dependent dioxygenase alkB n=1 Tax=Hibiscus syriacus TaxID=106335 RepID=A0A6A2WEC9_HIBSY|nr:Alpha-ketoglutarate-dependent dioxygenase alkB [Hibiscus syriacus]